MDNTRKLWLTRIALFSKIIFHIGIALAVLYGAFTVSEYQKWNDHSNKVINEIEIARNQYQTADYTGRNRNLSGLGHQAEINALRGEALSSIENLKPIVSDNPKQVKNLEQLSEAVKNRFAIQDEQFLSMTRDLTSVTYPLNPLTKSTTYLESVESLFAEIKMNELNILRLERSPKIFNSQWTTIYVLFFMIAVSFCITVYLNIVLQRNLVMNLPINRKMRKVEAEDKKADENFIKIPKADFESWSKLLQGE